MTALELYGPVDGSQVQELWPGRLCDRCRAQGKPRPWLATHARDAPGGGRDFYCVKHLPKEAP